MALHEAGLWNSFQTVVFDASAILPLDSTLGSILAGIFGYIAAPTVSEITAYLVFLIPALILFLMPYAAPKPQSGQAGQAAR